MKIRFGVVGASVLVAARALAFDTTSFRQPSAEFSPGYFWMWNAPLEQKTLCGQLDEMARLGIRSVCPHPFPKLFRPDHCATGMAPDYLTDGFMSAYSQVADHAAGLGMDLWLYDEGGWPSGSACRQVAKSDQDGRFQVRYLTVREDGAVELRTEPYGGDWGYLPSVVEPGATERFLKLTHAKYAVACGRHFGKSIKFTFTDEPTRPYDRPGKLPWTSDFDAEFRRRKGYAIRPFAVSLLAGTNATAAAEVQARIDYQDVMSQMFVDRYLLPIRNWCRAHGLGSGGHLNGEDMPENANLYGHGSVLRSLRMMDVPGVDTIWRQLFPDYPGKLGRQAPFPRYASSAARQNGTRHVLSESFCIYGDSLTPDQMKWTVDYQLVRGVNQFVFGYYAMSNAGQWMDLFEPHSGPVQPYWDFEGPFFAYVHRLGALLSQGRSMSEIAVLFDARDFWAGGEEGAAAARAHYGVSRALDRRNCEYDFVDDDQLVSAVIRDGRLVVGQMSYSTLVLPHSKRMLSAARQTVEAFRKAGGRVVEGTDVSGVPPTVAIAGVGAEDIRVLRRQDGEQRLFFLVNESVEPRRVRVALPNAGAGVLRADPVTGSFVSVGTDANGTLEWSFAGCGSVVFLVGDGSVAKSAPEPTSSLSLPLDGWQAKPLERVVCGKSDFERRTLPQAAMRPVALGDWRTWLGDGFSGKVLYRTTFDSPEDGTARLDLGCVRGACSICVNGVEVGTFFFGPFVLDAPVKAGENVLEVVVANTLANAISSDAVRDRIARDFPPLSSYDHRQRAIDREFNESGLFGPVGVRLLRRSDDFTLYNIVPYAAPGTEARTAHDMVEYRERTGCDLALYSLTLDPEGKPAMEKVRRYLASYRALRQELEGTGVRLGVLVQAILGHWKRVGKEMEDWTRTVNVKGEKVRYCPDDPDFAQYITDTFTLIAKEGPAFVLTDDDVRAYSHDAECFCPRHVAEFNRRRGTSLSEAEVRERVRAAKQDDEDYRVFLAVQRDMMHRLVRRFRAALDSVDPTIPAGICMSGEETFLAGPMARIIAAEGQTP